MTSCSVCADSIGDYRALQDIRMGVDFIFDFHRGYVLAAPPYCILGSVDKVIVAGFVAHQHIAGVKPLVPPRGHRPVRMVPIAVGNDPGPICPHQRFARHPSRHFRVPIINDPDLIEVRGQASAGPVVDQIEARPAWGSSSRSHPMLLRRRNRNGS